MSDNDTGTDAMTAEAIPASGTLPPAPEADAMPAADPMPAADAAAAAEATATMETIVAPAKTETVGRKSNARLAAIGWRLVRAVFVLALLIGGATVGWRVYLANQPFQATPGDPNLAGAPTPDVVKEFVGAIEANDADRIRSVLASEMFSRYTAEMERFGIATVDSVQTLATFADGDQTATAILLQAQTTDQIPFAINLVVLTQNGQIVRLR